VRYLLGVDAGTSSVKVSLTSEKGITVSDSSSTYGFEVPSAGWAEQDPELWWCEVRDVIAKISARVGVRSGDSVTIGFTGQMHSLVLLDENQKPLRPSILWCDERSVKQSTEIERRIPQFASITGNAPIPAFTLPQLIWVRENEPDIFDRAQTAMVPKDYLRLRATGTIGTEWTDASAMAMLDSHTRTWSTQILDGLDLDPALLPRVHAPNDLAGEVVGLFPDGVRSEAAFGVGDQFAEALSAGLVDAGQLSIVLGTSAVILGVTETAAPGAFCHAPFDRWLQLDSLHAGGLSLTWFRDRFAPGVSIGDLIAEAALAPAGSEGLLYLPFLARERRAAGSGLPGGFIGARHEHGRPHFVRAILEGVAFEMRRMSDSGGSGAVRELTLKAGGSKSKLWREIFAGVFGITVCVSGHDAAFGAAMTAGVATGWWTSYADVDPEKQSYSEPREELVNVYGQRYRDYEGVLARLSGHAAADGHEL
jgi:xylulokinase